MKKKVKENFICEGCKLTVSIVNTLFPIINDGITEYDDYESGSGFSSDGRYNSEQETKLDKIISQMGKIILKGKTELRCDGTKAWEMPFTLEKATDIANFLRNRHK